MRITWRSIYFVGIGGVGMSGLARIALADGCCVGGSDAAPSARVDALRQLGATVAIGHQQAGLPAGCELVVYSSAISAQNPLLVTAEERGIPALRRGLFLAEIAKSYKQVVAVGGSHGKTSITGMLAHVARSLGTEAGYLVGGEVPGQPNAALGNGSLFLTEVDESDATLAYIKPTIGVIANLDDDHSWSVGGVQALHAAFLRFAQQAEHVLAQDCEVLRTLLSDRAKLRFVPADAACPVSVLGSHSRYNAYLVREIWRQLGADVAAVEQALLAFPGVERRLTVRYAGEVTFVEDYAHHPQEIAAALEAVSTVPHQRIGVVFEPHRNERMKRYGTEFADLLRSADRVWVLPTFAAWVDDSALAAGVELATTIGPQASQAAADWSKLAAEIATWVEKGDLVLTLGAGNMHRLTAPLVEQLRAR